MFKKKTKDVTESDPDEQGTKKVTTETVEKREGVRTTTTTITCTKDNFDSAFKKLNLDPQKFQSGGTSITRQIIYTNSSGQKEVLEETVETYNSPENSTAQIKDAGNGKSLAQKLGFSKSPKSDKDTTAATSSDKLGFIKSKPSKDTPTASSNGTQKKATCVKAGKFEEDSLKQHNVYRQKHGVPKLTLSNEICSYAKEWADHLAATDKFEHRSERKYGENIYMKWSSDPNHLVTGEEAVDSWYSEIKDHTFGQEPRTLKSGHFTQVIWKESKELGVAWARSKTGKVLVVANYSPVGNFVGRFSENVPPPKN